VLCVVGELIAFDEKAALVAKQLWFDDEDFGKLGRDDVHLSQRFEFAVPRC
jgi:hypothetical protein